ncbi:hypothetical protein KY362_00605 [Candidatus Woesearchaeota archaeon]|nr:hypothetical protein [Candidatus Woesearchaeota archaeon]
MIRILAPLAAMYALSCAPEVRRLDEVDAGIDAAPDSDLDAAAEADMDTGTDVYDAAETEPPECHGRILFYNHVGECVVNLDDLTYNPGTGSIVGNATRRLHTEEGMNDHTFQVSMGQSFLVSAEFDEIDYAGRELEGDGESGAFRYLNVAEEGGHTYAVFLDFCGGEGPQQRQVEVTEEGGLLTGRLSTQDSRHRWSFVIDPENDYAMSIDLTGDGSRSGGKVGSVYNNGEQMPLDNGFDCEFE